MDKKLYEEVAKNLETRLLALFSKEAKIDADAAVKIIREFIMNREFDAEPFSRYEAYNEILEKAEAVAGGWLHNCLSEVSHYEDTKTSLENYISRTYGKAN